MRRPPTRHPLATWAPFVAALAWSAGCALDVVPAPTGLRSMDVVEGNSGSNAGGGAGSPANGTGASADGTGGAPGSCIEGAEGCACTAEELCLMGLVCSAGVCAEVDDDATDTLEQCSPGVYTGGLSGSYRSLSLGTLPVLVNSDGLGGALDGMRIEVTSSDGALAGSGEFNASVGGGLIPIHAEVVNGVLDCGALQFTADIVNGEYTTGGGAGMTQRFEGVMVASYDPATKELFGGLWSVAEDGVAPPLLTLGQVPPDPGPASGTGTWSATLSNNP